MSPRALAGVAAVVLIAAGAGWLALRATPGDPLGVDVTRVPITADGTSSAASELAAPVPATTEAVDRAPVHVDPQDTTSSEVVDAAPNSVSALGEPEPGVARGRVVDDLGTPVGVFILTATPTDWGSANRRQQVKNVREPSGRFEVFDLADGGWKLVASQFGTRASNTITIEMPADGGRELELVMPREGILTGRVLDATGAPRGNAIVHAQLIDSRGQWGRGDQATSEADGRFELEVASGRLRILAEFDDAATSEVLERTLKPGERLDGLTLILPRGGTIEGVVRDTRGIPLANTTVTVVASGEQAKRARETSTDPTGWFRLESVTPGVALVTATDPPKGSKFSAQAEVRDGQVVHVELGGGQAGMLLVSGTVRGSERTAGARLTFTRISRSSSDVPDLVGAAKADAAGRYELVLSSPGRYVAVVATDRNVRLRRIVEIAALQHSVVDFDLPSGRISGRVLGSDGAPIAGIWVSLEDTGIDEDSTSTSHEPLWTGTEGRFAFENVAAGTYRLRAGQQMGFGPDRGRTALAEGVLNAIELAGNAALEDLEIRLREAAILVARVIDARGSPAAGSQVRWLVDGIGGSAKADSAGVVRVEGLSAGQAKLTARDGTSAVAPDSFVSLRAGQTSETHLQLGAGSMLHVRLVDRTGTVVADEPVRPYIGVTGAGGVSWHDEKTSWGTGSSRHFGPLPDGEYDVWVKHRTLDVHHTVRMSGPSPQELLVVVPD